MYKQTASLDICVAQAERGFPRLGLTSRQHATRKTFQLQQGGLFGIPKFTVTQEQKTFHWQS